MRLQLLPPVLLQHICVFIQSRTILFALLQALPEQVRGPHLTGLLLLSNHLRRDTIWPGLRIYEISPTILPLLRLAAPLYTTAHIHSVLDLEALQLICSLAPHLKLRLYSWPDGNSFQGPLEAWYKGITKFPVRFIRMDERLSFQALGYFFQNLGNFRQLVELNLCNRSGEMINERMQTQFFSSLPTSTIKTLHLSSIRYTKADINSLAAWIAIGDSLVLDDSQLAFQEPFGQTSSLYYLVRAVRNSTTLTQLALDDIFAHPYIISLRNIKRPIRLMGLRLKSDRLSRAASEIITSLSVNSPVQNRNFDAIAETATEIIASAMVNSPLKRLHLAYSKLDARSLNALCLSLKESSLVALCLTHTKIGDDGCQLLAKGLLGPNRINTLRLTGNEITDTGALMLAGVVGKTKLELLGLEVNRIRLAGAMQLITKLQQCKREIKIELSWNSLNQDDLRRLGDAVDKTNVSIFLRDGKKPQ